MKKLIFAVLLAMSLGRVWAAEVIDAPMGQPGNINADYGGVDLWLSSFSASVSTIGLPVSALQNPQGTYGNIASTTLASRQRGRIYGAYFSSGNCTQNDFIDVFSSTGGFKDAGWPNGSGANGGGQLFTSNGASVRFYNLVGSSFTSAGSVCSGIAFLRWPIRTTGNIFMKPSNAAYNTQGLLYWLEP